MRIYARSLFDGERFGRDALIETRGSTIVAVSHGVAPPPPTPEPTPGTIVADSVLPGLIDAHAHLVWDATIDAAGRVEREGQTRTLLRAADHARRHLQAGVTTVRDLGSSAGLALLLAERTAAGLIRGPRVVAAGPALGSPGGHASTLTTPVSSARQAASTVEHLIGSGAAVIKLMASGGLHETSDRPDQLAMDPAIVAAAVSVARAANVPVAAHAHHPAVIGPLVKAGVTSIEHGALVDRPTARLMAQSSTVLVPTLTIFHAVTRMPGLDDQTRARYAAISRRAQEACRIAAGEGVTIAGGTDSGGPCTPHGSIATELELLSRSGLGPEGALAAVTSSAADLLGVAHNVGRIAVGMNADLVLARGDIRSDLSALSTVDRVILGGELLA